MRWRQLFKKSDACAIAHRLAATFVLLLLLGATTSWSADSRVAVVIGNSAYRKVEALPNPVNDAKAVGEALTRLHFKVYYYENLDYAGMRDAIRNFARNSNGADIGLVYYAGHGMEMDKKNYLIPVDAVLASDKDVDFEAIPLDLVLNTLEGNARLKLVLLDACRNNPFLSQMKRSIGGKRSLQRGLAGVDPSEGMLVSYSAKEGETAADGDGPHSPYTQALLDTIEKPGIEINMIFRVVRDEVLGKTGKQQEPFFYQSLPKDPVYFIPPESVTQVVVNNNQSTANETQNTAQPTPTTIVVQPAVDKEDQALRAFESLKDSQDPNDFQALVERYPDTFAATRAKNRIENLRQQQSALQQQHAALEQQKAGEAARQQQIQQQQTVPAETEAWYFAQFESTDLYGGDIGPAKGLKMNNESECAASCGADASCRAFTFNRQHQRCFLKSSYTFVQRVDGAISGLYFKSKPSQLNPALQSVTDSFPQSDLSGQNIGNYEGGSYFDCINACKSTMGCGGFAWVYFTRPSQCWLKAGSDLFPVYNRNSRKGVISGRLTGQMIRPSSVQPAYAKE